MSELREQVEQSRVACAFHHALRSCTRIAPIATRHQIPLVTDLVIAGVVAPSEKEESAFTVDNILRLLDALNKMPIPSKTSARDSTNVAHVSK